MRNKAINALLEMGMPADIKGFDFIVDAMEMFQNEEIRNGKTTFLYALIAKKNDSTAPRIERAIRHAFSVVLTKGNLEMAEKYLSLQRTTNGNLLHVLYIRLTQEVEI